MEVLPFADIIAKAALVIAKAALSLQLLIFSGTMIEVSNPFFFWISAITHFKILRDLELDQGENDVKDLLKFKNAMRLYTPELICSAEVSGFHFSLSSTL